MMTLIDALEFKRTLNKALRKFNYDFDAFFDAASGAYFIEFNIFLINKIGEIWLKSQVGIDYTRWNSSNSKH